jgi:hypothetical protein
MVYLERLFLLDVAEVGRLGQGEENGPIQAMSGAMAIGRTATDRVVIQN